MTAAALLASDARAHWRQRAADLAELGIEVLEAGWPVNHPAGPKEVE